MIDSRIAYVTVEHEFYGCDTGCCGWKAYAYDSGDNLLHESDFDFMHCYADAGDAADAEARDFAQSHFPGARWDKAKSDYACSL